jgi:hypothetical protein
MINPAFQNIVFRYSGYTSAKSAQSQQHGLWYLPRADAAKLSAAKAFP